LQAAALALGVFLTFWLVTLALPRTYEARARLLLRGPALDEASNASAVQGICGNWLRNALSDENLEPAVSGPGFEGWLRDRFGSTDYAPDKRLALLRKSLLLRVVPNSALVDVVFHDGNSYHAAANANRIAQALLHHQLEAAPGSAEVDAKAVLLEQAEPPSRFIKPNLPAWMTMGMLVAIGVGIVVALRIGSQKNQATAHDRSMGTRESNGPDRTIAKLALTLLLSGLLGTPLLLAISRRDDPALFFGGAALLLALVCGGLSWRQRLGRGVVFASLAILVGLSITTGILTGVISFEHIWGGDERRQKLEQVQSERRAELARMEGDRRQVFGPVVERILYDENRGTDLSLIDFDDGKQLALPALMDLTDPWLAAKGVDAMAATGPSYRGLWALNLRAQTSVGELEWQRITVARAQNILNAISARLTVTKFLLSADGALPKTFLFETREGGLGILQIVGFVEGPRGVKVRYKRVQSGNEIAAKEIPASAELWAPAGAPGEKPDVDAVVSEAKKLAEEGRYEEALQRHIWYHNHALEFGSGQTGVRLSFRLSEWIELSRRYPKAREALVEIRDRKTTEILEDRGSFELFMDVASINGYLQEKEATYMLFTALHKQDPVMARRCYPLARELLMKKGEYELCSRVIGDAQSELARLRQSREQFEKMRSRQVSVGPGVSRNYYDERFIKESCHLIEVLIGTARKAEAEQIREQALEVLDDPQLRSAVEDAEKKVAR
jgi:hypothetical protein